MDINKIRSIEGKKSLIKAKDKQYEVKWSIQWDDRLAAYYIFSFPTPVVGVIPMHGDYKLFPVGGNRYMQKEAALLIQKLIGISKCQS